MRVHTGISTDQIWEKNNSQATTEQTNITKKAARECIATTLSTVGYKNTLVNIHPHPKVHYLHYITRKITYFIFYPFVCSLFTWTNVWMLSNNERYNQQLQNSCELIPQATVCIKVNMLFLSLTSLDCFSKWVWLFLISSHAFACTNTKSTK